MKASLQDFITKIFTQIKNNFGNVDNTSDADKPISKAQKAEFDAINNNLDKLEYSNVAGGANIWDEKWEIGSLDTSTGEKIYNSGMIRSKNYIPVKPNTTYFAINPQGTMPTCAYDKNKNFISYINPVLGEFTTPNDCYYILFRCGLAYGTIYNNDIAFIEGSNGTYKPYIPSVKMLAEKTTQIDDLNILGWTVPTEMPIKNYVDSNGVFHQRVSRVDLGSLDWVYNSTYSEFYTKITDGKANGSNIGTDKAYCKNYTVNSINSSLALPDKNISVGTNFINSSTCALVVKDTAYTDATSFKTAMKGVYLYYELATEITINVDGNEAVTKVNDSLNDVEFLGWSVPSECPIKNYVDADGVFHQKVGRYILDDTYNNISEYKLSETGTFALNISSVIQDTSKQYLFANGWNNYGLTHADVVNSAIIGIDPYRNNNYMYINIKGGVSNLTELQSMLNEKPLVFFYELPTENIIKISNNAIDELKNDLDNLFSSNITGIKLNGSTLEVSFNNGTSVGKVSFEGMAEEETIIS